MQAGLKVWSINPAAHREAAIKLAAQGLCDFIEIYVVPNSQERIKFWQDCPLPKVIHAPHLAHNFNLADQALRNSNRAIFAEVQAYADQLDSSIIICHGGTGGSPAETIHQLTALQDTRIVLENKPYWQHPDFMPEGDRRCRGAEWEEFATIQNALQIKSCHDVTHTVCMANTLKLDPLQEIRRFEALQPVIHHLSDLITADDELDSHTALGAGQLDWQKILQLINPDTMLTLETPKISAEHLDDFANEVRMLRSAGF